MFLQCSFLIYYLLLISAQQSNKTSTASSFPPWLCPYFRPVLSVTVFPPAFFSYIELYTFTIIPVILGHQTWMLALMAYGLEYCIRQVFDFSSVNSVLTLGRYLQRHKQRRQIYTKKLWKGSGRRRAERTNQGILD